MFICSLKKEDNSDKKNKLSITFEMQYSINGYNSIIMEVEQSLKGVGVKIGVCYKFIEMFTVLDDTKLLE